MDKTAVEFAIDPAKIHDTFAAELPVGATQRPVAELTFSEPNGRPAWKTLPSLAVVATGDKAAGTDVVRSMAERAGVILSAVAHTRSERTLTSVRTCNLPLMAE